ncbi:hypothetical protein [Nocardioides endophyticus]|uniref:hypothetical protein n=1 Tax=Nocardioides endophyticus TaxID=1353775 RepID=UPI0031EA1C17
MTVAFEVGEHDGEGLPHVVKCRGLTVGPRASDQGDVRAQRPDDLTQSIRRA